MKKSICIILTAALLFLAVSCASDGNRDTENSVQPAGQSASAEESSPDGTGHSSVTLKEFKKEIRARKLGNVNEVNGEQGYEAALVTAEDRINYIYMNLPDGEMAYSVLTDSDGDGETDSDLTLEFRNEEYELYTMETSDPDLSGSAMYGKCIRDGSTILMVNGPLEKRSVVRKNADSFLQAFGYDAE